MSPGASEKVNCDDAVSPCAGEAVGRSACHPGISTTHVPAAMGDFSAQGHFAAETKGRLTYTFHPTTTAAVPCLTAPAVSAIESRGAEVLAVQVNHKLEGVMFCAVMLC